MSAPPRSPSTGRWDRARITRCTWCDFVDNKADFLKIKAQAQRIGEVKTFNRFLVEVPANVDVDDHTTAVVWCERFSQFISAGQYRTPG